LARREEQREERRKMHVYNPAAWNIWTDKKPFVRPRCRWNRESVVWTKKYDNGAQYVGHMKNGKRHGEGTYTWADGAKYVGAWKGGKQNGEGTYTYANGDKYVGAYKDGKKNGEGTKTKADGTSWTGEWENGKKK